MVVNPWGRRRWRRKVCGAICGSEMAGDFAAGIVDGVNVQVGLTFLDYFYEVGRRQRAGGHNLPNVAAVRLRGRGVDIEDDLALEVLGLVSIRVNVLGSDWRGEAAVAEFEDRLGFIGAQAQ